MAKGCERDTDGDGNCPLHPDGCPPAPTPEPQWLPIATAPHGKNVLLLYHSGLLVGIGWRGLAENSFWDVGNRAVVPTHWSPIPSELPPEFRT